ncbi:hypothetical protein PIB30_096889 [Stylosanthes scabra]|uniref:Uncharacterized protein n=1 Tax=Stylosanthes scabra TaxID=79078 RepID=A0ABU6ZUZ9_9FABA|nr:hypothetical protein [Stylosanthes scabra]
MLLPEEPPLTSFFSGRVATSFFSAAASVLAPNPGYALALRSCYCSPLPPPYTHRRRRCKLLKESTAKLERLPKLKMLILGKDAYNVQELSFNAEGFSQLNILRLIQLKELEQWTIKERALKKQRCFT